MSKFTKGPWVIQTPEIGYLFVKIGQAGVAVLSSETADPAYTESESKANAALIAAAPELYETLKMAEATLDVVGNHFNLSHTLATIKAALTKARGES